uniref:Transmembrane protein n=2 Tax=Caenorhabditis japonica TaxID=281687 RepID=A0A8R1IVF6_CAEJA
MSNKFIRENSTVDINHEYKGESESSDEEHVDEPRHRAGFEWAAPPNAFFLVGPQNIVMFGAACLVVIISFMSWIFARYYSFVIWAVLLTVIIGLILFFPELFCNLINMVIQFVLWIIFFMFSVAKFFEVTFTDDDFELKESFRLVFIMIAIPAKLVITSIVILILFRILSLQYKNREIK